jgi:hypothetical protein
LHDAARREGHRQVGAIGDWQTALSSVVGIYLITDTLDGCQYVGKADGAESIRQRWSVYAVNGNGGNVELRTISSTLTPARRLLGSGRISPSF